MHDQLIDAPPLNVSDRTHTVDPPDGGGDGPRVIAFGKCDPPRHLSSLDLVFQAAKLLVHGRYFEYRITELSTEKRSSK
jgi:hypothetical protein